jgi:outer membrane receptor for ferrienterochelin and colicins
MPERSSAFAAFVLLLAAAVPAAAQTPCESGLQAAEKSFGLGQFAEVPGQLAPCFQGRTSRTLQDQAYSLLARAYLAADEPAKARQAVSDLLRADPTFEPGPPPRFGQLVAEVRRAQATVEVTSVSKTKESLFEAPATVVVITGEEIERRGYLDLEQVLHDLPGLDSATTRDYNYSTIAVRGFVSGNTGRNLLLLDGVEQNDLSTNALYLSRQYPLSNVDRVEVVYGPASTIYGANAYTGVISVITKQPEALIAEDKRLGVVVQAAAGGLHTRYGDLTLAGKDASGNVSWSLASRYYHDDDTELSRFPAYQYDYTSVDYRDTLRLTGPLAQVFTSIHPCGASSLYACRFDTQGNLSSIELTPAGESLARQLDRQFLQQNHFVTSDPTGDWLVYGKLKIANLVLGAELWRAQESSAAFGSLASDGTFLFTPRQTLLYAKYSQPLGRELTFKAFLRYQQSGLDRSANHSGFLNTYANGALGLFNLVSPCTSFSQPPPLGCPGQPWDERGTVGDFSSQFRSELSLIYEPSPKFNAVGGVEIWKSSIQSTYDYQNMGPTGDLIPLPPPEQIEHTDLASYLQASYKPRDALKLVLAGRLNYNTIENRPGASGFGLLFSPRAAVVYTPIAGRLVLKAIYSEAFKDPTDTEKFGAIVIANEVPSGGLQPERVRNYELGAGWHPNDRLSFDAAAYQADYSGLVAFRFLPSCELEGGCFQYHNLNSYRIRGLMLDARYRLGMTEIDGNYTLTAPFQLDPRDLFGNPVLDAGGQPLHQLRIADVPGQGASLGANRDLPAHFNADLRLRYVGALPARLATNDLLPARDRIGSHVATQATVSYRGIMPGTTLQLTVDNLLDRTYFVPDRQPVLGVLIPNPGRVIILRLITGLGRPPRASPDS